MRIQQTKMQKIKMGLHGAQALLIFVAGCLTLAVMTKSGGFGGETGFYFALCFFTIPALIYQVMVPVWSRAWRFNNVFAFPAIDILFAVLWFAASIAVAVWNTNGIAKGNSATDESNKPSKRADDVKKDGTCASFAYGSQNKCEVSKAAVGFGIIICLTFAATAYISLRAVMDYRRTGVKPNVAFSKNWRQAEMVAGDDDAKDVWSTNTEELNNHSDDRLPYTQDDHAGLLHRRSEDDVDTHQPVDDMAHPGRRASWDAQDTNIYSPPAYDTGYAPSALSATSPPPLSPIGRLHFPEANYNALR